MEISWSDYEGIAGFGATSANQLNDLKKALTVGSSQNPPGSVTAGDGFAMRVESLERTMKNVTYRMEHLKLFKALSKLPAFNTVEEHNEIQSYGENPDAGWIAEGDLPESDDAKYERKFSVVKFLGTTRSVSHVATVIKPAHGPLIAQETVNGTMHLLRVLEGALFYGDSSLSSLQFDGLEKLLTDNAPTTNIIDMRGQPLSEDALEDGALTISDAPNYGTPTNFHGNPKVIADLAKTFFPKERHDSFGARKDGMIGNAVSGFMSQAGPVAFDSNSFVTVGPAPNAAAVGDATKIPASPTATTPMAAAAATTSYFGADDAGNYRYSIVACNRYGRSAAVAFDGAAAVAIAAGQKGAGEVTPGSAVSVEWYELYRTVVGGAVGNQSRILRIPNAAGAGTQAIEDINQYLPYTSSGFMLQQNTESLSLKQLCPMLKMDLALIDSSFRWMQLLYCVLTLYAPGKNVLYRNIGRSTGYIGAP